MADLKPIININELKTSLLRHKPILMDYDNNFDALRIYFDDPYQRSVVHYLDDYVALLFSPKSKKVIGIQVEAFEKTFIHKYSDLENAWTLRENCEEINLQNIGDMMFFVQKRQEPIAREVQSIARSLLFNHNDSLAVV